MVEPDWKQARPATVSVERAWGPESFAQVAFAEPVLEELLAELRTTHANGGAEFAQFSMSEDPTLDWFISRNRFSEIDLFGHLIRSGAFCAALPRLRGQENQEAFEWLWSSPYRLDGELAGALMTGGAHGKFKKGGRAAKDLGGRFCAALFGDRFEEVPVLKTHRPWSGWFHEQDWDTTWLGVDKGRGTIWLLALTDAD